MANPQRVPDPQDPMNPVPPLGADPFDARLNPANTQDPRYERTIVQQRSGGTGVLIAAVVLVLAVVAYFMFAPGTTNTPAPAEPTTAEPAAPAPDAMAPAPTAPEATAPAAPADPAAPAPDAVAPATPDASGAAPAAPAPAEPAPAQ